MGCCPAQAGGQYWMWGQSTHSHRCERPTQRCIRLEVVWIYRHCPPKGSHSALYASDVLREWEARQPVGRHESLLVSW